MATIVSSSSAVEIFMNSAHLEELTKTVNYIISVLDIMIRLYTLFKKAHSVQLLY